MSTYFYVYKLVHLETNEFYFGSRKCKCNPKDDIYMGSMKKWKPDKTKLIKTIIHIFYNYEDMIDLEKKLILDSKNDSLNRNYAIPNKKFYLTKSENTIGEKNGFYGKHHTEEHKQIISNKLKGANNPSYGKKWMTKDDKQIYVKKEDIDEYINNGWIFENLKSKNNSPYKTKRVWITNGTTNKYVKEEELCSILQSLDSSWKKGKTYSENGMNSIKDAAKRRIYNINQYENTKKRLTNTYYITNGVKNLRLLPEDAEKYLNNGWRRGRWQPAWNKKS